MIGDRLIAGGIRHWPNDTCTRDGKYRVGQLFRPSACNHGIAVKQYDEFTARCREALVGCFGISAASIIPVQLGPRCSRSKFLEVSCRPCIRTIVDNDESQFFRYPLTLHRLKARANLLDGIMDANDDVN